MASRIKLLIMTTLWSPAVFSNSTPNSCLTEVDSGEYQIGLECPIGDGLWGREPNGLDSQFWVQCGVISKLPDQKSLAMLAEHAAPQQIVFNKESDTYRCLLGPYQDHQYAVDVRNALKVTPKFGSASLRELDDTHVFHNSVPIKPIVPVKAIATSNPAVPIDLTAPVAPITAIDQALAVIKKRAQSNQAHSNQAQTSSPPEKAKAKNLPVISKALGDSTRAYHQLFGVMGPVPLSHERQNQEKRLPWLRASYRQANTVCQRDNLRLISADTLNELFKHTDAISTLPTHVPYWVSEGMAIDALIMIPKPMARNAALYVLCEPYS